MSKFIETLRSHRAGTVLLDLDERMKELVNAVRATGRKGEITLKIAVQPAARGNSEMLVVSDDIKANIPRPAQPQTNFFANDEGELQRNDPRQAEMKLVVLEAPKVIQPTVVQAVTATPVAVPRAANQ